MQIDFITVLIAVVSLIVLAIPGFLLAKFKMLPEKTVDALSTIVLYGCQPVMVFMSFQENYRPDIALNILYVALLTLVIHALMYFIIALIIRNKDNDVKKKSVKYASLFSNCGYMGLPFLSAVFSSASIGGEIIIYAATVIAVFNVFNWTLGVYIMTGDKKDMSLRKILLNPTIISIVLGALYFFIVRIPFVDLVEKGTEFSSFVSKINDSLNIIGDMVTPLALTVIGIRLANVSLKKLFLDKDAYVVSALKLVVMSVLTMLVVAYLPVDNIVKYVMFFLLSMPSATSTSMFAVSFKGDADSASVFVLLTTLLSVITIPIMYLLMSGVFVPM